MQELRGTLDEVLSGRGRVLMLAGEPGIGKTRTAEELAARGAAAGRAGGGGPLPRGRGGSGLLALGSGPAHSHGGPAQGAPAGAARRGRTGHRAPRARAPAAASRSPRFRCRGIGAGPLPPLRQHRRASSEVRAATDRWCSSSTTCTGPTSPACGSCSSWCARCATPGWRCSAPIATWSCVASIPLRWCWASWPGAPLPAHPAARSGAERRLPASSRTPRGAAPRRRWCAPSSR